MHRKIGVLILIMFILAGQAKGSQDTSETPTKSEDAWSAMLNTPRVKPVPPLAYTLNKKLWKMFSFTRPCFDSGANSLCASARPDKDKRDPIPHVTVIYTFRF